MAMNSRTVDDLAPGAGRPPQGLRLWFAGARLRTVPVSVMPVLVGAASVRSHAVWWRVLLALVVSVGVQVGTNYGNDYSDGIRGTDAVRVGPTRLVAQGLATPRAVLAASLASFGIAGIAGLGIAAVTSWWVVLAGAACIVAGWFYTGGSRPYGYYGFGELSVLVFFGVVAVGGSAYAAAGRVPAVAWLASVPVGLLAVALLVANNLRDIPTDAVTGKRTLAVRIGQRRTRLLYAGCMLAPTASAVALAFLRPWALLAVLACPVAVAPVRRVLAGEAGRDLIVSLLDTARTQLAYGLLLGIGLAVGG